MKKLAKKEGSFPGLGAFLQEACFALGTLALAEHQDCGSHASSASKEPSSCASSATCQSKIDRCANVRINETSQNRPRKGIQVRCQTSGADATTICCLGCSQEWCGRLSCCRSCGGRARMPRRAAFGFNLTQQIPVTLAVVRSPFTTKRVRAAESRNNADKAQLLLL